MTTIEYHHASHHQHLSEGSIRVLLVEDDDVDAQRVQRILQQAKGFEIQHVNSLSQAIPIILSDNIDVILLDLGLSDCLCLKAISSLTSMTSAPIVVLSGADPTAGVRSTILSSGASSFISKSNNVENCLVRSICKTLEIPMG